MTSQQVDLPKPGPSDRDAVAPVAVLPLAGEVASLFGARLAPAPLRAPSAAVGVS